LDHHANSGPAALSESGGFASIEPNAKRLECGGEATALIGSRF
jgi:hypothetical protein